LKVIHCEAAIKNLELLALAFDVDFLLQWTPTCKRRTEFTSRSTGEVCLDSLVCTLPDETLAFRTCNVNTTAATVEPHSIEKLREEELEEARAIQSAMLPAESLRAGYVRISHQFQPVTEVGGDFLDYFKLSDGCVGLYLGDVSGKGLPAALYAALAVGTLRGVHKTGQSPSDVLSTLNRRLLLRGVPRRYCTVQYAVFDPRTHEMRIASAGMPGPLHSSARGCSVLEIPGIPPGLINFADYDTSTLELEEGDSVLFCTDGITEAFNPEDEAFGIERLQRLCEAPRCMSSSALLGGIFSAVESFRCGRNQHDDMAAAVFHWESEAEERP
jgi:serine phosphatase RsbU (regulator of sigma subunit)